MIVELNAFLIFKGMCGKTNCSQLQNAMCENGQCICKDGYKRDGMQCKKGKCTYIVIP